MKILKKNFSIKFPYFYRNKMEREKEYFLNTIRNYFEFDRDYVKSVKYVDGINIKSRSCHQNLKCHMVSRTNAENDSNLKVVPCLIINANSVIVHFMNYDIENEIYIDDTLGVDSNNYDYYIFTCDWIDYPTYKNRPGDALRTMKDDLFNRFCKSEKLVKRLKEHFGEDGII